MVSLVTLPSEILTTILEPLLNAQIPIPIWSVRTHRWSPGKGIYFDLVEEHIRRRKILPRTGLSLLKVNRHISALALRVFYSRNTFSFLNVHDLEPVLSWLTGIGENAKHINFLRIHPRPPQEHQHIIGLPWYYPHSHRHLKPEQPHPSLRRTDEPKPHVEYRNDIALLRSLTRERIAHHPLVISICSRNPTILQSMIDNRPEADTMAVRWRLHQSGSPNEDDPVVVHDVEVKHVQDGDSDDYVPTLDRELTDFLDSGWIKVHEEISDYYPRAEKPADRTTKRWVMLRETDRTRLPRDDLDRLLRFEDWLWSDRHAAAFTCYYCASCEISKAMLFGADTCRP